jgi:hypothetical protein
MFQKKSTSHGGRRKGAGRKKGSLSTRTQAIAAAASAGGVTPLEYMLSILRDETAEKAERFQAAKECAPYIHPRLAAIEHSGDAENPIAVIATTPSPTAWEDAHCDDDRNGAETATN